jgi:hypothetical protein
MLEEADFSDSHSDEATSGLSARPHALYMIQMTELSIVREYFPFEPERVVLICVVGHIIKTGFATKKSSTLEADRARVEQELARWEARLPSEMKYQDLNSELGTEFWSNMLHLAYKYDTDWIPRFMLLLTSVAIISYFSTDRDSPSLHRRLRLAALRL